jgi:hypothetical protein
MNHAGSERLDRLAPTAIGHKNSSRSSKHGASEIVLQCDIRLATNTHTHSQHKRNLRAVSIRRVVPTALRRDLATAARFGAGRLGLETELGAERHDPFVLEEFDSADALSGIALEAFLQEVDTGLAELVARGELRWVALGDVVHDGPFVVHRCPGAAAGRHFEDHAAERPYVDGAVAARGAAADNLGGHVHWGSGHGTLTALTRVGGEGTALSCNEFSSAKIDVFDYTVVVKEDV